MACPGPRTAPFDEPAPDAGTKEPARTSPADTAERLLLLLHYSIDWERSWLADPRYRKTYWDELLPGRVRRAAYRADTLDRWWSDVSIQLEVCAPRQRDRRPS